MREAASDALETKTRRAAEAWGTAGLALAGAGAGTIAGFVGNPAEIVLVRMQGDAARPPAERYGYKHAFDALAKLVRSEGFSALARGLGPNLTRSILMNASQLASYDAFKALFANYSLSGTPLHLAASVAAGTVATTVCAPADYLKSRVMSAKEGSVAEVLKHAIKDEGLSVLMRGWLPAWTRLAPTTVLTFLVLEQLRAAWDRGSIW